MSAVVGPGGSGLLVPGCPRCPTPEEDTEAGPACPVHGPGPRVWRPATPSYAAFGAHLLAADGFPSYLPWPLRPGWRISDVAVVLRGEGDVLATMTCCSGPSDLDGPVDAMIVAEEPGTGLGARCAGLPSDDPGADVGGGQVAGRVRVGTQPVALWAVSVAGAGGDLDRSVFVGEAFGRWLWLVLHPASAMLLLREEWLLQDVAGMGPQLVELGFGGPAPAW